MSAKRFATRAFRDAGTEKEYEAGEKLTDLDAGTLLNYEHAGLASAARPSRSKVAVTADQADATKTA